MKAMKAIKKEIKKYMEDHPDCEVTIKAIIMCDGDHDDTIVLESCPPAGCTVCPDPENPLCPS